MADATTRGFRAVRAFRGFPGFRWRGLAMAAVLLVAGPVYAAPGVVVTEPFDGVTYTHRTHTLPYDLSIHILEIDLTNPDISFLMTPKNGSGSHENNYQNTRSFVSSVGAQMGINASFFATDNGVRVNRGLVASEGDVYSPFGETGDTTRPWPVLNISMDNIVQIVNRASAQGVTTDPSIPLYNAVSGSERIVTNGVNTAGQVTYGQPTTRHPRTVAGVTADQRLILMVVDSGVTGTRRGFLSSESADLLISYGVVDAINLDGGGSSTMVMARPTATVINNPSDGSPRSVATSLAVFAGEATTQQDLAIFADFYGGDRGTFNLAPDHSGSTKGILSSSTNQAIKSDEAVARGWFQRLTILDDPNVDSDVENPDGWFVRHNSGTLANAAQNITRPTTGYVGFWARTETEGVQASFAIDAPGNGDRGVRQALIADGEWHLYEWNLEDDAQWEGWAGGDGLIDSDTFTIDSLHFFGPNADAVIDIDMISHNAYGSMQIPEPSSMSLLLLITSLAATRRRRASV